MLPVVILLCVYLLMRIQRRIYRKYWDQNVSVDISFETRCVMEREPIRVHVTVTNGKRLPLPALSLLFTLPQNFRELRTNDNNVIDSWRRNELFALFSGQRAERTLVFSCEQRGIYRLKEYELNCRSFLMDQDCSRKYAMEAVLYVYPSAVNMRRFLTRFQTIYGSIIANDFHYEDVFQIRGVREYQPFDSQRRINWIASAKLGSLMVNNYEYTTSRKVVIFLNLALDQLAQERMIGEESIRLVKTWCMRLDKNGIQCNIYTNGTDAESGEYVRLEKENIRKNYMEAVNEALTRIELRDSEEDFFGCYAEELDRCKKDHFILIISAYQRPSFQKDLLALAAETGNFSWIIPVNNNSDFRPDTRLRKHAVAWDVYWRRERRL